MIASFCLFLIYSNQPSIPVCRICCAEKNSVTHRHWTTIELGRSYEVSATGVD